MYNYESQLELKRSPLGDGGLETELELLLATLCLEPDCISTTFVWKGNKQMKQKEKNEQNFKGNNIYSCKDIFGNYCIIKTNV